DPVSVGGRALEISGRCPGWNVAGQGRPRAERVRVRRVKAIGSTSRAGGQCKEENDTFAHGGPPSERHRLGESRLGVNAARRRNRAERKRADSALPSWTFVGKGARRIARACARLLPRAITRPEVGCARSCALPS